MISVTHAVVAILAWAALALGMSRGVFAGRAPDPQVASAFALAVLIAGAAGSVAAIVAGRTVWSPSRAFALDLAAYAATAWAIALLELAAWPRDLGGVIAAAVVVVRLAPGALAIVSGAPSWVSLVLAFGLYGAFASWLPVASAPFGDQIDYLMDAGRLAHGSIDTPIDSGLFTSILGIAPSPTDAATHVAQTALGPRPIQGYAMPLLLLPGWVLAGRLGAGMVMAILGAWTSFQMLLILRDLIRERSRVSAAPDGQTRRRDASSISAWTWLIASAFMPMSLLATHLYPNMVGAAIVSTAYRLGFTASVRRPALAAALLALTLFLNPRDGLVLLVLVPFLMFKTVPAARDGEGRSSTAAERFGMSRARWKSWRPAPSARAVVLAVAIVALVAVVSNALLYGVPLPYAGYLFGTGQAQAVTHEPSIVLSFWIGLPASLFDRTFGLAGSAPWLFIGLLGLVPALRRDRTLVPAAGERVRLVPAAGERVRLLPAAVTVGVSLVALSFFRLWEGGYAPPGRYFVDVLPLWAPFVAYGLAAAVSCALKRPGEKQDGRRDRPGGLLEAARRPWSALATVLVAGALFMSALTAFVLNAVPSLALNGAFDDKIRYAVGRILGIDPLGWLPSFQPVTPTWWIGAYLALIPGLIVAAALTWSGAKTSPAEPTAALDGLDPVRSL